MPARTKIFSFVASHFLLFNTQTRFSTYFCNGFYFTVYWSSISVICIVYMYMTLNTVNVNKGPTRCNSMQTFIHCHVTLHVSGVTHPSSGVLKTVSATSGVCHGNGTVTSFHLGLIRTGVKKKWLQPFKTRIKSHLLFAGIIRSSPFSPR